MKPFASRKEAARGATLIEFSLVLVVFLTFMLGVADFARMLLNWAQAGEAARAGVRYAVVCDDGTRQAQVLARMQAQMPQIAAIALDWAPAGCTTATCQSVTLRITQLNFQWISPVAGLAARASTAMPAFATRATREVMYQDPNSNTACT
jgi:Flp pilus assembly protein TadG